MHPLFTDLLVRTSVNLFRGSMVALVTPMNADGSLCRSSLERLVEWHLEQGTQAVVAVGTTGESATLDVSEHIKVIDWIVKSVNNRVPVIGGTGANSTSEGIELTKKVADLGVSACMQVCPYYNKPPQEGLYRHFLAIAESAPEIPQILYNVPGRTAVDMLPDTVGRLSEVDNIVGIKESVDDPERMSTLLESCSAAIERGFSVLSGDDFSMVELMARGGHGCISVTANIAPQKVRQICDLALAGETDRARNANEQLMPLHHGLFAVSNPIPCKWALYRKGMIPEGIRLPLIPLPDAQQLELERVLTDLDLLT